MMSQKIDLLIIDLIDESFSGFLVYSQNCEKKRFKTSFKK